MRVLITSSRTPFALDMVRKLSRAGCEVFAADVYDAAPGSHSRYLAGHFTNASPQHDTARFLDDVERIVADCAIEVLVPAFEEAFYLATAYERLSRHTRLYTGSFPALASLHDKSAFQRLARDLGLPTPPTVVATSDDELRSAIERLPRYFARAAFSRGGVSLLTNTGPLAGHVAVEDCHPTLSSPWLVQDFVDGPMVCTYSTLHEGRVSAHCAYRAPRQWEHSTGIQFLSIDGSASLEVVARIAAALDYTGQLSFDFVEGEQGLTLIECNPRATDGVLLMSASQLAAGLLEPGGELTIVAPGEMVELDFAVLAQAFSQGPRGMPAALHDLRHVRDAGSGWHDRVPTLYSFLAFAHHERLGHREHKGLFEAMADDMCWDGGPIAGMGPDAVAALERLEAARASA